MSMLYFLIFVGCCAVGLIWLVLRPGGKSRERAKSGARSTKAAHHLRKPGHHPLPHHHAHMHHEDKRDVWKPRHPHAAEGHWGRGTQGSYSFIAKKIDSDDEAESGKHEAGVTMPAIKYEPTELELPKTSTSKR